MADWALWIAVALGGASGAIVRASIYRVVERADGLAGIPGLSALPGFSRLAGLGPAGATLLVNVLGSFLLGFLIGNPPAIPVAWEAAGRAFVVTGLCGAVTTFSTLCADAIRMADLGDWRRAAVYLAGHAIFGIGALFAGLSIGA